MRTAMMNHIMTLPLGYIESEGTGKIRKIVTDSSAATETYLAHTLPDKAVSKATPIGLIILMAVFDWRLGIMCLIPAAIGFVFMFHEWKRSGRKYETVSEFLGSHVSRSG